jgi:membrane-associated phospholipid phosphatase
VSRTADADLQMFATRRIVILVGILALILFVGSAMLYDTAGAGDSQLARLMNADRGVALTMIMVASSSYGREYFWIVILAVMLIFGKRETRVMVVELAVLFVIGIVAGELLKHLIFRTRPFETMADIVTRVPREYDSSFPSGHALIVAIGATFALLKFKRKSVALLLTIEASIVAYSRVYVGMHYPLDIVAGLSLGAAIALLGASLLEKPIGEQLQRLPNL